MPFFSIIIPTHNRLELLRETLASIEHQTYADYEVIVVDDGSTDGTVEALSCHSQIRMICQQKSGPGAARNAGAAAAKGTYLAFLDSDDLWFPWTLAVYFKVAQEEGSPSFITGAPFVFREPGEHVGVANETILIERFADYFESWDEWRWFSASSFVIRKDVFTAVQGFHERWGAEDAHLAIKLGCSRGFVHIKQPYTFAYREQHDSLKVDPTYSPNGARLMIADELHGHFPGGSERARERRQIIARHVRPVTFNLLRCGQRQAAWELYRAMFAWHLRTGRWRYLLGYSAFAFRDTVSRWISRTIPEAKHRSAD